MKGIVQFINSLSIRFNKKSIWKKLVERNKKIKLYNFVIANNNLSIVYGKNSTVRAIFYYFFWSRNMLLCDRPETFELIYKDVTERNHLLKEYDYNEIIEFRCLEEQKSIEAQESEKKRKEEEKRAEEKRRNDEEERKRRNSYYSSSKDEDKKDSSSLASWILWH